MREQEKRRAAGLEGSLLALLEHEECYLSHYLARKWAVFVKLDDSR